jgi:hypothetical protein
VGGSLTAPGSSGESFDFGQDLMEHVDLDQEIVWLISWSVSSLFAWVFTLIFVPKGGRSNRPWHSV